ncbi:DinB superfamily protein [Polystyrenella longa]|uniref:DinB superfamily protein n=1 Tax=Polystyrenella longa TaxID=2528007 RepID=A0A518CIA7_9PLAN|nr:DinB family protein [Polystyrenella longa]QDU78973.1 DinB superfamily protein [Polystyrenella longa]
MPINVSDQLSAHFRSYSTARLLDATRQVNRCLKILTKEQIWTRPNEVSNAVGNLVLHLTGNVNQWILTSLTAIPDQRDRPAEFNQRDPLPTEDIAAQLTNTVDSACRVIDRLEPERLIQGINIQGYDTTVLGAVYHVVEHFSLHTGQIVYATKLHINQDLSLYDEHGQRFDGNKPSAP